MTEAELSNAIKLAVQHLVAIDLHERMENRPSIDSVSEHPDKDRCFFDYAGLMSELTSIERDLQRGRTRLANLRNHFARGEMQPFDKCGRAIATACELATKSVVDIQNAMRQAQQDHPPQTREMTLQKAAVFEAASLVGARDRRVRSVAKRIMQAAAITEPSEASLTCWVNALR